LTQMLSSPARHREQTRHGQTWYTITFVPGSSAPEGSVSRTCPHISWPGRCGSSSSLLKGICPRDVLTSLKHTPHVSTSMRAWPERSWGSGTSILSRGAPYSVTAIALIDRRFRDRG